MRSIRSILLLAVLLLAVFCPVQADGESLKLSSTLQDALNLLLPTQSVSVIVQTEGPPSLLLRALVTTLGGVVGPNFTSINGFPARISLTGLLTLILDPGVRRVSQDWTVLSLADSAAPYSGATKVWRDYGVTGRGVGVAVIDSGLASHPDLTSTTTRRVVRVSTIQTSLLSSLLFNSSSTADDFGHGTHVAGIIGGSGASSSGPLAFKTFKGVAYGADIIGVKALGADGSGWTSDILRAIDWVISNRSTYKIRVLNISLGHPIEESYLLDPLCRAVEAAWRSGIVVVVSAGNFGEYGYASILSPGNDPYVITVGAAADWNTLDRGDDAVASFSSLGPTSIDGIIKPDIVASGIQIVSTRSAGSWIDVNYPMTRIPYSFFLRSGSSSPSPYAAYSGTSMAAPVVSGAAALMLSKYPTLNPDTVKARLMLSAWSLNDEAVRMGSGTIDLDAAMARTDVTRRSMEAQSPRVSSTVGPDGVSTISISDPASLYDSLWGEDAGQIAIWGNRAQWGQIAIWGGRSSGQIAIWGGRAQTGPDTLTATE
ncbi:MAG TPA: S8 family peptidase [Candidatus Polarisedimenticolia bacterium]|jgi:serine protease AprX